jgi:putative DNA primase/helicase
VAVYPYTDESGNVLFEVVRYEPKTFAQRRPDGQGGYIYNINGVRRVLYKLPDVLRAASRARPSI